MAERSLEVFINARLVGVLREENDIWAFDYAPTWINAPDSFDLSPALPRSQHHCVDGASQRPVQWYFDNLLPEEALRAVLAKEAQLDLEDAMGLLGHFGAESAGSLVLQVPGQPRTAALGLRALTDAALAARIERLPQVSLNHEAPKHMSLAGAQHKLPVVWRDGVLYEPLAGDVSTHILKPDHPESIYPATVINEYFVMKLAQALQLPTPPVMRRYIPFPVYIVQRFDRVKTGPQVLRHHLIDACQLLNKSRSFKYRAAHLDTLVELVTLCRTRGSTRLWLFQWLVLNMLVGNGDNHLKNISFLVSDAGIEIAPVYDLLSTAVYGTRALAQEHASWPNMELALSLPGASHFADVSRAVLLQAGAALGLAKATVEREMDRLVSQIGPAADSLIAQIEQENQTLPVEAKRFFGGEMRVLRSIRHIVIEEMRRKLGPGLN